MGKYMAKHTESEKPTIYRTGDDDEHKTGSRVNKSNGLKTAAIVMMGAAILSLTGCGDKEAGAEAPRTTTTIESVDTSSTTEPSIETTTTNNEIGSNSIELNREPTAEDIRIDAELFSNPEALSEVFLDRYESWINAGATIENATSALRSTTETIEEFAARIASEYDLIFIQSLVAGGDTITATDDASIEEHFKNKPEVAAHLKRVMKIHRETLTLYFYTAFPDINPQDIEAYVRKVGLVEVVSSELRDNGLLVIVRVERETDNLDKNRGLELTGRDQALDAVGQPTLTYSAVGGEVLLENIIPAK